MYLFFSVTNQETDKKLFLVKLLICSNPKCDHEEAITYKIIIQMHTHTHTQKDI